MMIGIPGSGKSSEAEIIAREHDAIIHASDKLREEMFGNINHQKDNGKLFCELQARICRDLKAGKNVVYDATNINSRKRIAFLKTLKNIKCEKIGIIMATPYETCLQNNRDRERSIPEEIIKRMYMNFQTPYYYEGFDMIQTVLWEQGYESWLPYTVINTYKEYNQENKHHDLTLGDHLEASGNYIMERYIKHEPGYTPELFWAALLHDCGKPFTKTIKKYNGEEDGDAHYYNHMNVGAYDVFFWLASINVNALLVSWLVCNHMEPYFWKKGSGEEGRKRKLWGELLFQKIRKLHEADVAAH